MQIPNVFLYLALIGSSLHFSSAPAFADLKLPKRLVAAALERTRHTVAYDGRYVSIKYPGGDVPKDIGVCSDVVIRSFRKLGIDLQQKIHEDMVKHFELYPSFWGLKAPDSNIDHRRVPNLRIFFKRHGVELPETRRGGDYKPGDLVTWNLKKSGHLPHIGIVTDQKSRDGMRPLIVHNIGEGPKLEDVLFDFKITGHYRYPAE
ncbi:MAG: DUF1287 domain-containing protein [Candidatus Nitronauta litoralis]|uniref:DUF1287 domain-containing protein n=1 Tax=Candidatus Nitronauta litoralis TaxID=2705533 RepID=A0A7T0BYA8_9BACT|nr:MAG: DUF1287 domain-containing protein [Candidatus Nitronauta litoralis]